jgi:hypothetical protein
MKVAIPAKRGKSLPEIGLYDSGLLVMIHANMLFAKDQYNFKLAETKRFYLNLAITDLVNVSR